MLRKEITYKNLDEVEVTEVFYFNLSRAELLEMQLEHQGGLSAMLEAIIASDDKAEMVKIFKDIIFRAYGVKAPDGKQFVKSKELSTWFSQTEAYTELFMELAGDAEAAAVFVNGILPKQAIEIGNTTVKQPAVEVETPLPGRPMSFQ